MVSHIDLFPTICDLLGIDKPSWVQGTSIMPVVRGESDQVNDEIFAEVTYHAAYEPQRAVRTQRWKYIRRFEDRQGPVLANCDDSPSKDLWLKHGWQERRPALEQLYDLIFDPNESNNIADDPAKEDVLNMMRARLVEWMKATDDPLLQGTVPAPSGAIINDPDSPSPNSLTRIVP
jgi:arylsulfatase A-like enzyme